MHIVSIILPTYNRAKFLPQAFDSIKAQLFQNWELIVVDDGSTDDTRMLVAELTRGWPQLVRYVYQENQGAYGARNTGLDLARGEYIAFYDSDDVWLPHHLKDCVEGLEANPDVDWVYGASRIIDSTDGHAASGNSFYVKGRPRPFLCLRAKPSGRLRIITDDHVSECMLLHGTYSGLQSSVLRRTIFDHYRFDSVSRNESEDQLLVVHALVNGRRLAYYDNVHIDYYIHSGNSSAAGATSSVDKHLRIFGTLTAGYEGLRQKLAMTQSQIRALNRRLAREYFWHLGYFLLRQPGYGDQALQHMRRALRLWPWDIGTWKTFALAWWRVRYCRKSSTNATAL